MIYCNTDIYIAPILVYHKSYPIYIDCININILEQYISIYISTKNRMYLKDTSCFELSQLEGKFINILLINTGTVYVALSFRFVVNANTFCFMTIVVSTRNTINTEVVKTNIFVIQDQIRS